MFHYCSLLPVHSHSCWWVARQPLRILSWLRRDKCFQTPERTRVQHACGAGNQRWTGSDSTQVVRLAGNASHQYESQTETNLAWSLKGPMNDIQAVIGKVISAALLHHLRGPPRKSVRQSPHGLVRIVHKVCAAGIVFEDTPSPYSRTK